MRGGSIPLVVAAAASMIACAAGGEERLYVYAAASLEDAVTEIARAFEADGGPRVVLNFAGSNALAQQIRHGAPADLFYSADARWMDDLEEEGLVVSGSRVAFLSNRLVVVRHERADFSMSRLGDLASLDFAYLAIGDPTAVPAGRYARVALEAVSLGEGSLWDSLADRVAPAVDVRAALALVRAEPTAIGLVYASDLIGAHGVRLLNDLEASESPVIRYHAAQLGRRGSVDGHRDAARSFLDFSCSRPAEGIYRRHGFLLLTQSETRGG